jgi:hypothetical protein
MSSSVLTLFSFGFAHSVATTSLTVDFYFLIRGAIA